MKSGSYCIKVTQLGNCAINKVEQFAILTYSDTHQVSPSEYESYGALVQKCRNSVSIKEGSYMNHPNTTCFDPSDENHCSADLSALDVDMNLLNATVDQRFFIGFNNYLVTPSEMFESERYETFISELKLFKLKTF